MAKKLPSSLAVEGELPEDGLAAYGDDGDDLMLALARKIVAGEDDADSVESVFAQAQQAAAEAEALLVDAEWAAPEPVAADVVAAVAGDDAEEPQRSLFSWAEFMAEEPEEPKRRRRGEAPTLSLFEWGTREGARGGTGRRGALNRSTRGGHRIHSDGLPALLLCVAVPSLTPLPPMCARTWLACA